MDKTDIYPEVINHIIRQQELIIGPIAIERAKNVKEITIDEASKVTILGDPLLAISKLVEEYKVLFGQISVEVCKEAAAPYINGLSSDDIPAILR